MLDRSITMSSEYDRHWLLLYLHPCTTCKLCKSLYTSYTKPRTYFTSVIKSTDMRAIINFTKKVFLQICTVCLYIYKSRLQNDDSYFIMFFLDIIDGMVDDIEYYCRYPLIYFLLLMSGNLAGNVHKADWLLNTFSQIIILQVAFDVCWTCENN